MRKIKLTRGKYALVDDEDYKMLKQFNWCAVKMGNTFYAVRGTTINRKVRVIPMHRLITNAPNGLDVDHIDHNGLNNQRRNLRLCTHSENTRNRNGLNRNNTSGYRGVWFEKEGGKFRAEITFNGKKINLGYFKRAEEASRAYQDAAIKMFGSFFNPNG